MIYAMIDFTQDRIVDVLAISGDPNVTAAQQRTTFMVELAAVYFKLTGDSQRKFKDLDEVREAVSEAIFRKAFGNTKLVAETTEKVKNGPVSIVKRICTEMHGRPRWEVIEACAKAGVKRSTASVQYQKFKTKAAEATKRH